MFFQTRQAMVPTDFAKLLTGFLTGYLPHQRGISTNTLKAYKDTFILLINYMDTNGIKAENLTLAQINRDSINGFLDWLQTERGAGNSTRNVRLAAIRSFYRYVQYEAPERIYEAQRILSIKAKRTEKPTIEYLTVEGITLLLRQPNVNTHRGLRDVALLSLMYDTGARVQEIIDLTPGCVRFDSPYTIRITGKGNKTRIVPLQEEQVGLLKKYLEANKLDKTQAHSYPLFSNSRKEKLTRAGVSYILLKYAKLARKHNDRLIPKISCHSIRHSKAMHLLQAGVNLVYIRDFLGHVSIQTTEVYARADSKQKRQALEKAYVEVKPDVNPYWLENKNLLGWLKSF
jgi:site-specific recombinase XerD